MLTLLIAGCADAGSDSPVSAPVASKRASSTTKASVALASRPQHVRRLARRLETTIVKAPLIHFDPIPFPKRRKREMAAYAFRHYGVHTYRLADPRVIVEHYTETPDFQSTYNTFAPDHPDAELHELPNTCAHFVVDRDGAIHQLVALTVMCRHTVGLNYTAIGIENVGYSDQQILHDRAEMKASLALTRWLMCRYRISLGNVIGHSESLRSSYHHEDIRSLRTQTHSDWRHVDMKLYRSRLAKLICR